MARQNVFGPLVGALNHRTHLFVDDAGCLLAVWLGEAVLAAAVVIAAVAHALVQTVHTYHCVGLLRHLLQIAQRPCGDFAEHDFLGCAPAKGGAHLVKHLLGGGDGTLLGEVPSGTQALAPWHNAHLHKRRRKFDQPADHCVPRLMERDGVLLVFADDF